MKYFAYGSNMLTERLQDRVSSVNMKNPRSWPNQTKSADEKRLQDNLHRQRVGNSGTNVVSYPSAPENPPTHPKP